MQCSLMPRQIFNYGTSLAELYVFIYIKAAIKGGKALNGKFHMSQQKRNRVYCEKSGRSQLMPGVQNSGRKDAVATTFFTVALNKLRAGDADLHF